MYKVPYVEIKQRTTRQKHDVVKQPDRTTTQAALRSQLQVLTRRDLLSAREDGSCSSLMTGGLCVRQGHIVIVEVDRGQDLGTVQHSDITPAQAR